MMEVGGHHIMNFTLVISDPKQEVEAEPKAVEAEPKGIGKLFSFQVSDYIHILHLISFLELDSSL